MENFQPQAAVTLDPERQEKARQMARIQRRLMLVDLLIGAIYLLAWLVFGWSAALADALAARTSLPALQVAGYAIILAVFTCF